MKASIKLHEHAEPWEPFIFVDMTVETLQADAPFVPAHGGAYVCLTIGDKHYTVHSVIDLIMLGRMMEAYLGQLPIAERAP